MNEGMGQLGRTTFDYHWKSMESLVGTKNLVLLVATIAFSFFEIYKGGIKCAGSVVLSKMVTHYGPRSGFLYYSMTTSLQMSALSTFDGTWYAYHGCNG